MKQTQSQWRAGAIKRAAALIAAALLSGCGEKDASDKQMQALCAKDGGVKIHETVTLPKSEFTKGGMPLGRYWANQSDQESKLGPNYRYFERSEFIKQGNTLKGEVQMRRSVEKVFRRSDGKLLGESISYGRSGGDPYIALLFGGHPSSLTCPNPPAAFLINVFIKE